MSSVNKYLRSVRRHLLCSATDKSSLISALRMDISDQFADEKVGYDTLVRTFGEPAETAEALMLGMTEVSRRRYNRAAIFIVVGSLALILAFCLVLKAFTSCFAPNTQPTEDYNSTYIEDGTNYGRRGQVYKGG